MANGKPGDNPITDLLDYGGRPFPADVARMVRRLHALRPARLAELGLEPFAWERGEELDRARAWLRQALGEAGDREPLPRLSAVGAVSWRLRLALRRFTRGPLRRWLRPVLRRAAVPHDDPRKPS
jgi:hypothetical protein